MKIHNYLISVTLLLIIVSFNNLVRASDTLVVFNNDDELIENLHQFYIYEDVSNSLSLKEVLKLDSFQLNSLPSPNLGLNKSTFWIKLNIKNNSSFKNFILGISNPLIDEALLYEGNSAGDYVRVETLGDNQYFSARSYDHQNLLFNVNINAGNSSSYIIKVKSWEQLILPIFIGTQKPVYESLLSQDLVFGLFFGIMFVLVFYNLFLFIIVKDRNYLYYVTYIFCIALTQAALNGYSFRFIFPNHPEISNISLILFNSIAGLATIKFIQSFLNTKKHFPILNRGYLIIAILYISGIITVLFGLKQISYKLMDLGGFLISFYSLFIAIRIAIKGNRYAILFLISWSFFLVGVILFVLKNSGVLPSNSFTNYTMTIGIAIEGILLSIALADRINTLRKEKENSQIQAFDALEKNEQLVREQNIILEQKVKERTDKLNNTLVNLKETQSQLVDAEKMSALGQLTAGVAHEINNPINFVSSNISPLKQDIDDLKTIIEKYEEINASSNVSEKLMEIEQLKQQLDYEFLKTELNTIIKGIENGANRTTEIVKGLRNFSRLDENDLMLADLNEGLDSTLAILKSNANNILILKNLNPLPRINCNPGKLNQVFLNVINNAIQATKENNRRKEQGEINIKSFEDENDIKIVISDNGIGISDDVKEKIFDPFFTTKKVGDGTGLGLSIAYRIIENHKGQINVESELNKGTTFTIIIPKQ